MAVLTAKKVSKRFGGLEALSAIDLEIKEQSIQSIIGPNGAGKTTFFNSQIHYRGRCSKDREI